MKPLATVFDWYFLPKQFEISGRFYRAIGIGIFGQVIRSTVGRVVLQLRPKKELYSYFVVNPRSIDSIRRTEHWSRFNEVVHLFFTIFCVIVAVVFYRRGYSGGIVLMVFFGVFNLQLTLLQRFNRTRLLQMIALLERRRN